MPDLIDTIATGGISGTGRLDPDANGILVIDDSGTPGAAAKSPLLHTNRKTWVAVAVPPSMRMDLQQALERFIDGVRGDYGAKELHFTDIYAGRGPYKGVSIDKRYELFDLMGGVFEAFGLPILNQTCSPQFLGEIQRWLKTPLPDFGWFNLNNHEHVGLLFLLFRVRIFIREDRRAFPTALPLVIDQGLMKSGSSLQMPQWADTFAGGYATFRASHDEPFLQLADFAAFVLSRTQWIVSGGIVKHHDREFLKIVSGERLWYVNTLSAPIIANESSAKEYERLLRGDRISKGLPADPPL